MLTLLSFLPISQTEGQNWTPVESSEITIQTGSIDIVPNKFQLYRVNDAEIKAILDDAPTEEEKVDGDMSMGKNVIIKLGLPDGESEEFMIYEYKMMESGLASQFPDFKTYYGNSISNPLHHVRIDYTTHGLRAMILSPDGSIFIDHFQRNDKNHKIVYYKKDFSKPITWFCGVKGNGFSEKDKNKIDSRIGDCGIRHQYRLAIAATGEYTTFHGGTVALAMAAIMTTMNRVNGVFEKDCAVRMILVANNSSIVYTNPATDPYTNGDPDMMINQNQANIDAVIGNANYDIGHVFGTNSGGLAGLGVTCAAGAKALGVTGSSAPIGDPFDIDYVAHEIGHQFNANHTQYNDCNRNNPTSVEPGSASTIMGYAGICPPDVQSNSNDYFSTASLYEIRPFVVSNTCDVEVVVTNSAPSVTALSNYSIPTSTPFVLTASASDPNGMLTYCWEQIDIFTGTLRTMPPAATNVDGPMFRSLTPIVSPLRYFPNLPDVLNNVNPTWEELPSVGRPMNFRVTVRDNFATAGCTGEAQNIVTTVAGTGPFLVTSPNTAVTYTGNSSQTITWNVAGTTAAPVSCANVNILLTTDGGTTFTSLASNTANDGSESITIPNITTSTARVWIQCANNIFYDVSNVNFTIQAALPPCADLVFPSCTTAVNIDFAGFGGAGFSPMPNANQLCSNHWAWTGWSNGNLAFGGTQTTANTDYTRGNTPGGVTAGGIYSLNNGALYIQPGGSDWAPGTATLRIQNTSGSNMTDMMVGYDLLVRNDQARSNSFNFSYSLDDITYTPVASLDFTSTAAADAMPTIVTVPRSTTLTGLTLANNAYIYFRWSGADVGGSGSRDEFGLDNLSFTPACNNCPSFTNFTPNNVTVVNSTCSAPTCMLMGGIINAAVNNCPSGSTLQYSTDAGMTWSTTVPVYDQDGPSQTVITRCNCDLNNAISSNPSNPVSTNPGTCPPSCNCTLNGMVSNVACNNSETTNTADDFITFDLIVTGGGGNSSMSITTTPGTPTPNSALAYNVTHSITMQPGSAGGGNIILLATDDNNSDCYTTMITDPGTCSNIDFSVSISDPCVCNNDATPAQNDGTFDEQITVLGPAGETITGTCTGCSPTALTFTETSPGVYESNIFTHIDNLGYNVSITAGNSQLNIGNKCAYPNVAIDPIGPLCNNGNPVALTAVITGDDGSGGYTWSGTGVSGSSFDPFNLAANNYTITLNYDGVDLGNVSPDGGITPAFPGCIQVATGSVTVLDSVAITQPPNQTLCANTSTNPVNFMSVPSNVKYSWTNDNTAIGLAASGMGNIPTFIATNPGSTPITANITVTAMVMDTFNFTGQVQQYIVPPGVTSIEIETWGAQGANGTVGNAPGNGGLGGYSKGTLAVTPGETLYLNVGGQNGFNGGGPAGIHIGTGAQTFPGNGGGGSDIRQGGAALANRVLVAAGGGGGGAANNNSCTSNAQRNGAVGGGLTGADGAGSANECTLPAAGGGMGANQVNGGIGGTFTFNCNNNTLPGFAGLLGQGGAGGNGGNNGCFPNSQGGPGGGGGGGYFGGGGGGAGFGGGGGSGSGGGGGGGSSYIGGVTNGMTTSGIKSGNGRIVINPGLYADCMPSPKTFTITVNPLPDPPVIPNITVCQGGSTLIVAGTITTPTGPPVSVTYNFEGDNPASTTTNNMFATGNNAVIGTGVSTLTFPQGCGSLDAMSANNWSQPTEVAAVANNDYFEFVVNNTSAVNTLVINGFSFSGRISTTGPTNWALYQGTTAIGFFGTTTSASTPTPCGNYTTNTLNLVVAPASNAIIRIYAWGNTPAQSTGTFRIDDVVVSGTSNPPSNNFKFYNVDPTGGMATPIFTGSQYDPMTTPATSPQSIWVTECSAAGCESLPTRVIVTVSANPTITIPTINPLCAPNFFNINNFNFNPNPPGGTFSYHNTLSDAQMDINPITSGLNNINTTRTIYVRYELANNCFTVGTLQFIVHPMPPPPVVPATVSTCAGESPLIKVNIDNYPVEYLWNFEGNITGNGISSQPTIAGNGPVQSAGAGLNSVGFQVAGSGCGDAITSAGYEAGNITLAAAVASQEYFEFCVGSALPGIIYAGVNGITIRHRASGTGPINWAVVASNNLTTPLASGIVGTGCTLHTGAFALNTATCYRVYYWGATSLSGTLRIDEFRVAANYQNNATYRFYTVNPTTNPNATPVFTGVCYQTNLTVQNGPTTYWVTCQNPVTGCVSNPSNVIAQVFPDPVVTVFNSCAGGSTVTFQVSGATGGTWSVSGGGTINPTTGVFTPTTAGCFTATYLAPGNCDDTKSFVVFPSAPAAPMISNTCNTSFVVPVLQPFGGFTAQYSFNGGNTWGTSNTSPTTPGCYQVVTRYILTNTCGTTLAGSVGPAACQQSGIREVVIFPAAPPAPVISNTCNTAITIPVLTAVTGFRPEYSFDGGMTWSTNNVSSTTPGCYATRSRYVLAAACGTPYPAGTTAPPACLQSPVTNAVIYPAAPVITMPPATCMTNFVLPTVTPVPNFTIEYSINGSTFTSTPMSTMAPGCYTIITRYVLTTTCGATLAGSPGPVACAQSNTVIANVLPIPDVLDQPDILVCNLELISPLPFISTVAVPTCLGTSIEYFWTNSNPDIGLPASGMGNIPPFTAQNPGLAIITVTPRITLNGVICEGTSISFNIVVHQPIALACNNGLNISVDRNCGIKAFVDMFLEGTYNDYFYSVRFFAYTGVEIDINDIHLFLGTRLQYEIIDNCNGNRCWGYVTFEDKYPPVIICPDFEVNCIEEPNLYLPINSPDFIGYPEIQDNCSGAEENLNMSYLETGNTCNKVIIRRWQTSDQSGNLSNECLQTIRVRPLSFSEIFIPNPLVLLECKTATDPASIVAATGDVRDGYAFVLIDGEPLPLTGQVCNIVGSYTDLPIEACGPHCHGNIKVIRTWQFIDWCQGIVSQPVTQLIKSADLEAPTFILKDTIVSTSPWYCAADFDLPRPWELHDNCDINPTYYVSGPGIVTITGNQVDGYRAKGAPKGQHIFCYTAEDCCGNISTQCMIVTVVDKTPPVPSTKQNIVLGLVSGGPGQDEGNAKLFTYHVDNYSYDMCSAVRLEIRRPAGAPQCNNDGRIDPVTGKPYNNNVTFNDNKPRLHQDDNIDDTDNGEFVKFCCEDLKTGVDIDGDGEVNIGYHEVILRVWDDGDMNAQWGSAGDNYNESWAYVKVEDKAPPVIQCPPNMTIHCDWAITYSSDLGSGAQSTEGVDFTKTGLPVAYGTCGPRPITFRDNTGQLNQCKLGNVTRDFFVTPAKAGVDAPSCRQVITILPSTSTQPWIVTPPSAAPVAITCADPTAKEIKDNGPKWVNGPCDVIGENIKVHKFLFEDGVCIKWRVEYNYINWCYPEGHPDHARGPYFKDFMYFDNNKPVIDNCDPLMFGVDANCEHRLVLTNKATDTGGCNGDNGWLKWQVFIDLWADGSDDWEFSSFLPVGNDEANAANGNLAAIRDDNNNGIPDIYVAPTAENGIITITVPEIIVGKMSNHKVSWKVTDGCHNHTTCHQPVMVVDKKPPTPYCLSLSTALMADPDGSGPLRPMVELWAIDFNVGSFDNCTPQEDLLFTFNNWAPQVTDTIIDGRTVNIDVPHYFDVNGAVWPYPTTNADVLSRYNRGDLQLWLPNLRSSARVWTESVMAGERKIELPVMMSVWDKKFEVDFCMVNLTIICNTCPIEGSSRISGTVTTEEGKGVANVEIRLTTTGNPSNTSEMTDVNGYYSIQNIQASSGLLYPYKNTEHGNGVSTLDLVLIQRHILGIQKFESPYKIMAADVNNDTKINTVDLVELRKVILGASPVFTNKSWRFVDAKVTMDMNSVFPFYETVNVNINTATMDNMNYMAVKIGDVNGSASTDVINAQSETRTASRLDLTAAERSVEAGETFEIAVTAANFNEIFGFQYTMNLHGANFVDVVSGAIEVTESNVGVISSDVITMSYAAREAVSLRADEVLFTIVLKADKAGQLSDMIQLNSNVTRAESYVGSTIKVQNIGLTVGSVDAAAQIELFQNEPNPFKATTNVNFFMPEADNARLTVYDVTGRVINVRNINAVQGLNTEAYTREQLGTSGMLYYKLESGDFTASKKMIIIE
ncbi:MAG: T9SS type A sorting domain-containing protein [Saprospiraceae bacterium]|nr:T9SS type A sorting domain-containing protein [Saprospiraceae bacterium]